MKRLDKFSLLIENEEMGREVKRIANHAEINPARMDFDIIDSYYNFKDKGFFKPCDEEPMYEAITFDQFKEMFEGEIIKWEPKNDTYWKAIVVKNGN